MKHIRERSFMINGLTAKWGIGENRVPPIWDNNLIGYWDARDLPNGKLNTVANKATLATKAPDLTVNGATIAKGTLQFDGVDDNAETGNFMFPSEFTVFWDIDWLGRENRTAGIMFPSTLRVYNFAASGEIRCSVKDGTKEGDIPNTSVGLSTNGNIYAPNGSITPFGGTIGTTTKEAHLYIARVGNNYTQLGFRQLLIFNKELSPTEVNEVLTTMFPV